MKAKNQWLSGLQCALLFSAVLFLTACALPSNYSAAKRSQVLSHEGAERAEAYLKLAAESPPLTALSYQLQAAELLLQFGKIPEAKRILRAIPTNTAVDPSVRRSILNARLALLKQDPASAQLILKAIRDQITQQIPIPDFTENTRRQGRCIALLLPSKGPHAQSAKMIQDGFLAAYYQNSKTPSPDRHISTIASSDPSTTGTDTTTIKIYDIASGNQMHKVYQQALRDQVDLIVGPLSKDEVQNMVNIPLSIPVLALNRITTPSKNIPDQLYQFGLLPEDEVQAASALAYKHGHRQALLLYADNDWGNRLAGAFKTDWQAQGGQLRDSRSFKSSSELDSKIKSLLSFKEGQRRTDADFIFIAANREQAQKIKPLLNFYDAESLAVYSTAALYTGTPHPNQDQALNGIHFCDSPWILENSHHLQEIQESVQKVWAQSANAAPRLFAFGMDAYQIAMELLKHGPLSLKQDLRGFTGHLSLDAHHHIQRGLVCAKFDKGIPMADPRTP